MSSKTTRVSSATLKEAMPDRRRCFLLLVLISVAHVCLPANAQSLQSVWQWSVTAKSEKPPGSARAFLWVPPGSHLLRGVVVAQDNMEERSILENPRFRKTLADLDFAEMWVSPSFDHVFRFDQGAGDTFNGIMKDLAGISGYNELNFVPVVPMGHSAAASWPYYFATWNPERTLAAISVSGQWPYFRDPIYAPDIWGDKKIDYVPALETMGEYEAAGTWAANGLRDRKQHPLTPLSMLANPAQGHFASTDQKVDYLGLYLRKAVQYRMPKKWPGTSAPLLLPIDPTKTGWLVDKWRGNQPPLAPPAPVGQYKGDPDQAFWYFDEELAKETARYEAVDRGLKVELVGLVQDGAMVPQTNTHLQLTPKFEPEADGITFELHGAFYDGVPGGSPRPAVWTGLPAGSPVGHANGGAPIQIGVIQGPVEQIAPNLFRVAMQKETLPGGVNGSGKYELVFAATHPGDAEYRPAVQQAHIYIPAVNKEGTAQHIDFTNIPDQKKGIGSIRLKATSSAHLPVSFYVREGPATVSGDVLTFTDIPVRAKFPIAVTVVAWQYGRSMEPKVQSALPVAHTFYIVR